MNRLTALALIGLCSTLAACQSSNLAGMATTSAAPAVAHLVGPGELSHASLPPSLRAMDPRVAYRPPVAAPPRSQSYIQPASYHAPRSQSSIPLQGPTSPYQTAHHPTAYAQMNVPEIGCPADCPVGCPTHSACPLPTETRIALPMVAGVERPATSAELYPDEYFCDGGDVGFPTRVEKDGSVILQFEETVGTFLDDEAIVHVEPSTRACVYSPSFAAVRTISRPIVDIDVDRAAGASEKVAAVGNENFYGPEAQRQIDIGMQTRVRSRVSELDVDRADANMGSVVAADRQEKLLGAFQDYGFVGDYLLSAESIALLNEGIAAAVAWQRNDAPYVVAFDENSLETIGQTVSQEYFNYKDERPAGKLRLMKTADVRTAKSGETVTFTIRYENTGGKPVFGVTVVDHLSPRLEIDRDSVACDRDADVFFEDDGEGSVYLKVRLTEPLDNNDGGLVTFTCTVK